MNTNLQPLYKPAVKLYILGFYFLFILCVFYVCLLSFYFCLAAVQLNTFFILHEMCCCCSNVMLCKHANILKSLDLPLFQLLWVLKKSQNRILV